ncbi:MAG: methionyl-tRNA formyltransferase [Tannerella sp.]|jgi:methionyl-tRNA formyltransferase|nr:methionyl-tRNA formyltransferase [Tannerella sp.]
MTKSELKIVFMGTPDFAAESLRSLVEGDYKVVAVVTTPDKPVGRHGNTLQPSAVKQYALSAGLPVLQPEKLKDERFLKELKSYNADLQIVVAFRMLPEIVWDMPKFGTFNLHASLLPQYRGAAPINWVIINGEKETGVTTFFLTHEIDTGKIILQKRIPIKASDDAEAVHDNLMTIGAELVTKTVDLLISSNGNITTVAQENLLENAGELHAAPKIFKDTCRINWTLSVENVYNFIRGLSPSPAAWTELILPTSEPQPLKIFQTEKVFENHSIECGSIITDGKQHIDIAVKGGFIRALSLQLAGKKRMNTKDFLNGTKINNGWKVK